MESAGPGNRIGQSQGALAKHLCGDVDEPARAISAAARRENVSSRMRRGSAPLMIRCATLCASVLVLPEPAPAIIKSGPASASAAPPCSTARRCCGLSFVRYGAFIAAVLVAAGPRSLAILRANRPPARDSPSIRTDREQDAKDELRRNYRALDQAAGVKARGHRGAG